jgi:uncharacterized protein YpmB
MVWNLDVNTIVLLIVAVMNAITLYFTRRTEKNTNSMKDALVASTAKASLAEGEAKGLQQGRDEYNSNLPL